MFSTAFKYFWAREVCTVNVSELPMSPEKMGIVERFYRTCGDTELESNQNFQLKRTWFYNWGVPIVDVKRQVGPLNPIKNKQWELQLGNNIS